MIQGKRTKQQVLVEFLETFETQLDIMQGRARDGKVTLEEFTEYYRSISSSIDDDDYFVVVLNNSWNINGNADPYKKFERGWIADDAQPAAINKDKTPLFGSNKPVQRSGQMSSANPLTTTAQYYKPQYNAAVGNTTTQYMHNGPPKESKVVKSYKEEVRSALDIKLGNSICNTDQGVIIQGPSAMPKYQQLLVEKFRSKLT